MATPKASTTVTIKFIPKLGTLTAYLIADGGDIVQFYTDAGATLPSFVDQPRTIRFVARSSSASGELDISHLQAINVGGAEVSFNSATGVSQGAWEGVFQKQGDNTLIIKADLAQKLGYASSTLTITAAVQNGTSAGKPRMEYVAASIPLIVRKASAGEKQMTIAVLDTSDFGQPGSLVLSSQTDRVSLFAKVYESGLEVDPQNLIAGGFDFIWKKLTGGSYATITHQQGKTEFDTRTHVCTVLREAVDNYAEIRCELQKGGTLFCADNVGVHDIADQYVIDPNPAPIDMAIEEGVNEKVVFTPRLRRLEGDTSQDVPCDKYNFTPYDDAGSIATDRVTKAAAAHTFTLADAQRGLRHLSIETAL